jgi:hypothetical protein
MTWTEKPVKPILPHSKKISAYNWDTKKHEVVEVEGEPIFNGAWEVKIRNLHGKEGYARYEQRHWHLNLQIQNH